MSIREQILQATLDLCARRGIAATSLQDIADASNCSKANVVYHFSHKEELIDEALASSLEATEKLVSATAIRGLASDADRVAFAQNLVELLVSHRLATHIVITHPYFVDSVPALKKAQALMGQLADLVADHSSGEHDRLRFGIVISGVTYTLVSASILELESVPEDQLATMLTDAVTSMVMGAPLDLEASR
ncbi:MAG: TetR/AcrR family transcriptional regulator [Actinobacteria bacterium]|nr:TetR/AcrR family transcriptional regulator [Actinomycetota bacterium]